MDNNRIKPVSPSPTRLKYENNHKNQKRNKQHKQTPESNTDDKSTDNGNVIDDFA